MGWGERKRWERRRKREKNREKGGVKVERGDEATGKPGNRGNHGGKEREAGTIDGGRENEVEETRKGRRREREREREK